MTYNALFLQNIWFATMSGFSVLLAVCLLVSCCQCPTEAAKLTKKDLDERLKKLEAAAAAEKVAFLAQAQNPIEGHYQNYHSESKMPFGKVVFNHGGGFEGTSGVFTAPSDGVYTFSYNVFPAVNGHVRVDIMKNDYIISASRTLANGEPSPVSMAASVIETAKAGDTFWLRLREGGGYFWAHYHTYFSGALLFAL